MRRWSVLVLTAILLLPNAASAGVIAIWSGACEGECNAPDGNDFVAIAAGKGHALALRSDGTLAAWGSNNNGECDVPDSNDFVAVAAGDYHSLGLRANGVVEAWGHNSSGQCDVPDGNYIAIGAGVFHSLGIRTDGSIAYWGMNENAPNMPPPPTGNFVAVDGGWRHSMALDANDTLAAWGADMCYDDNTPDGNFVEFAIHACQGCWPVNFALREDGSIIGWGCCYGDWCNVPDGNGFQDIGPYVAIDANGALTAWKNCLIEIPAVPPDINDPNGKPAQRIIPDGNGFVAVDAGNCFGIALRSSETFNLMVSVEPNFIDSVVPAVGEYEHYRGEWVYINAPRDPNCPVTYKFDHWEGDVEDPNAQSQYLTMNGNRTIKAVYVADTAVCGDECHPILKGDLNEDCYINLEDFAIYAASWLSCTHPDCD